jgi:hypothetical protein
MYQLQQISGYSQSLCQEEDLKRFRRVKSSERGYEAAEGFR